MPKFYKVSELAKLTGLTVRTLHHYDAIGLLKPSHHSGSGHRLYIKKDISRLQQIISLRHIGISLHEIKNCLKDPEYSPLHIIEMQIGHIKNVILKEEKILKTLEAIHHRIQIHQDITVQEMIQTIQEVIMFEKYYTDEQMQYLENRAKEVGDERIQSVQEEWKDLMEKVQQAKDEGFDPTQEPMLSYARKWQSLIDEFTGGDKGIEMSLNNVYQNEPQVYEHHGYGQITGLMDYVGKAISALKN